MEITYNVTKKSFWALKVNEVLDLLETTNNGLTDEEIKERLKIFGKNEIEERKKIAKLKLFLNQFKNPLIFLLIIAGIITLIVKDYTGTAAIFSAAFINCILGFYQENKAEEALTHLKSYIKERVRVMRNDREFEIDSRDLVPGDVIRISQGNRIPADCRLVYTNNFLVDEAILTGEALPANKSTDPVNFEMAIGDQSPMVFSGTMAVQGFANAVVCRIGPETEIGRIASLVKNQKQDKTPLQKAISDFSIKASIIILLATTAIFFIGTVAGNSILEMFLTSIAILVSAIPEGLPVAMTVILAIGVQRLAKKNGIIRKLLAVETLGSTSVILTDKTGTLTEAKMELSKVINYSNTKDFNEETIMKFSLADSDVIIENPKDPYNKWRIIGRPLEIALVRAAGKHGILPHHLKKELKVLNYLPFNSSNKFSASIIEYKSKIFLCLMGAPEILIRVSTETPHEKRKEIMKEIDKIAYNGERIIGIAIKEMAREEEIFLAPKQKFSGLKFLAAISFTDPIRPGVRNTIHKIEQIGIRTVIVTGDHRGTAEAVAKELGFPIKEINVINGTELDAMSNEELKNRLPYLRVVSRVSPEGKMKIAKAFQDIGKVIAMTGDGINDAPSLKQADIGVAMGSGTDVAKDIAELVLLDNNFETIVAAIEEGRRTMENIRKVIIYLFSDVLNELLLIGSSLIFSASIPLNALQILWVNMIEDSAPALSLAFEDHMDYLLMKPKKTPLKLLDAEMQKLIAICGIPTALILFGIYALLLKQGFDPELVRTFVFASFGTYSLFTIFSLRNLRKSIFKYDFFSNQYLLASVGLGLLLIAIAIYIPFFQNLLETVPLPPIWILGVLGIGFMNMLIIEFGKWMYRK
ncbi:MAG: HAD-IC family P-type ATPase, partial [Patescibacteria group bacterium]